MIKEITEWSELEAIADEIPTSCISSRTRNSSSYQNARFDFENNPWVHYYSFDGSNHDQGKKGYIRVFELEDGHIVDYCSYDLEFDKRLAELAQIITSEEKPNFYVSKNKAEYRKILRVGEIQKIRLNIDPQPRKTEDVNLDKTNWVYNLNS